MDAMAAAGWKTITMGELGDDLRLGITPEPKTFVITFDDGYEDGYKNAFPALLSHGFRATFFVIASRIGSPGLPLGIRDAGSSWRPATRSATTATRTRTWRT